MQAKVFSEAGFSCTVMDPPYANYDEPPIFKGFEDLKNTTCHSAIGRYNDAWCAEHGVELINFRTIRIRRNFLLFGLFKSVPMILRPFVAYHDFWRPDKSTEGRDLKRFLDNYAILDYLPRLTKLIGTDDTTTQSATKSNAIKSNTPTKSLTNGATGSNKSDGNETFIDANDNLTDATLANSNTTFTNTTSNSKTFDKANSSLTSEAVLNKTASETVNKDATELFDEEGENCFVIMDNEAKHDSVILQLPDFKPATVVDNSAFDTKKKWFNIPEFYATTAVYIKLGEWFKFLKENGIWDNTRIIITADHGSSTRDSAIFPESVTPYPYEKLNPVLMVKDFASSGRLKSDYTFMTNADIPALSFDGVIKDAKNPFTLKPIKKLSTQEKNEKAIISLGRANGVLATKNNGYNIRDKDWWTVHDSIFSSDNWKRLYEK